MVLNDWRKTHLQARNDHILLLVTQVLGLIQRPVFSSPPWDPPLTSQEANFFFIQA
jgi:hypothetical protein